MRLRFPDSQSPTSPCIDRKEKTTDGCGRAADGAAAAPLTILTRALTSPSLSADTICDIPGLYSPGGSERGLSDARLLSPPALRSPTYLAFDLKCTGSRCFLIKVLPLRSPSF